MKEIVIKIHNTPQNDHERWVLKNGTPLPKGHGRLGELDILRAKIFIASTDKYFMPTKLLTCDDVTDIIDGMPTIIEADKEG